MTAIFNNFKVTAVQSDDCRTSPWNPKNTNHHLIYVHNTEKGMWNYFSFWASIAEPKLESEYDVLNAFYCIVSDAIAGEMGFEEFYREFGYDDPDEALRAWNGCQKTSRKLKGIYDGDIYELVNELSENYG